MVPRVVGYQTASAGFPPQWQRCASPMSSSGCLFLSSDLCCFASLDFGLTEVHCAQAWADLCLLENSFLLPVLIGKLSGERRRTALNRTPYLRQLLRQDTSYPWVWWGSTKGTSVEKLTFLVNTSHYWLQAPYVQPSAWLPAQGIPAWALCCGCTWSWISSPAG